MRAALLCLPLLITACASTPSPENMVPATLLDPTGDVRVELGKTVTKALGGRTVTLDPYSLTGSSKMSVELTSNARDPYGNPANGRIMTAPQIDRFTLSKQGTACWLLHVNTGEYYPLREATCVKE